MNKSYNFSRFNKILFYYTYIYKKLFAFLEIKEGAREVYIAEVIWFLNRVLKTNFLLPRRFAKGYFHTIYGKYYVPPDLLSTITVSPAFERNDIDFLKSLIKKEKGKKILFIDIGANFGLYTILIGNYFRKYNLDIISFEPNTSYLNLPTFAYIKKNILRNKLKRVTLYKVGIGVSKEIKNKEFQIKKLETILGHSFLLKYDVVFIKLDVDDYVVTALHGIKSSLINSNKVILLVEDFVDKRSISYLNKNFRFLRKLSTYNSFWIKQ